MYSDFQFNQYNIFLSIIFFLPSPYGQCKFLEAYLSLALNKGSWLWMTFSIHIAFSSLVAGLS